jgi:hypothetical protein
VITGRLRPGSVQKLLTENHPQSMKLQSFPTVLMAVPAGGGSNGKRVSRMVWFGLCLLLEEVDFSSRFC